MHYLRMEYIISITYKCDFCWVSVKETIKHVMTEALLGLTPSQHALMHFSLKDVFHLNIDVELRVNDLFLQQNKQVKLIYFLLS